MDAAPRVGRSPRIPYIAQTRSPALLQVSIDTGKEVTGMFARYIYVARMDIEHDKEALFNEIYDLEHVPEISKVSGVVVVTRYRTSCRAYPRYLALYEMDKPDAPTSQQWKTARDIGRWPTEVRPYTMNRHHALYSWAAGDKGLTGRSKYLYLVMTDVEGDKEAVYGELHGSACLPFLKAVRGVGKVVRYTTDAEKHPRHLVIHEMDRPDVHTSEAFGKANTPPRWDIEVNPYMYNTHGVLYEPIL
jgi:hypothetical protein